METNPLDYARAEEDTAIFPALADCFARAEQERWCCSSCVRLNYLRKLLVIHFIGNSRDHGLVDFPYDRLRLELQQKKHFKTANLNQK